MDFVSFYVYCSERPGRTEVFTGSAADAFFLVYDRDPYSCTFFFRIASRPMATAVSVPDFDHLDGSCRTVPCTVSAFDVIGHDDAVLLDPYSMAYLYGGFFGDSNRPYRSGRADIGTFRAFRPAVSTFIGHLRLHQSHQTSGRSQYIIGADRDTQLTGSAVLIEIPQAHGSWRDDSRLPFGYCLFFYRCKSSVHFLFLGFGNCRRRYDCGSGNEISSGSASDLV